MISFVLSSGPGLILILHGMTAQPPTAIVHVQGALRDSHRPGEDRRHGPHRGGRRVGDHLQGEAARDDCHQGGVTRDVHRQRRDVRTETANILTRR